MEPGVALKVTVVSCEYSCKKKFSSIEWYDCRTRRWRRLTVVTRQGRDQESGGHFVLVLSCDLEALLQYSIILSHISTMAFLKYSAAFHT